MYTMSLQKIQQKQLKVQLILVTRILSVKNLLDKDDSPQSDFISQWRLTSMTKPMHFEYMYNYMLKIMHL